METKLIGMAFIAIGILPVVFVLMRRRELLNSATKAIAALGWSLTFVWFGIQLIYGD
jgi:hypothetical protein